MSKTKIALLVSTLACAQWADAGTLEELVNAQRDALRAESQRKAEPNRPPTAPVAAPVQAAVRPAKAAGDQRASELEDARLVAVYGPVGKLTAEIMTNGAVFPVKQGGDAIEGWRAESISQSRVVLQKLSANGKTTRTQTMYLSQAASNPAGATVQAPGAYVPPFPSQMPAPFPSSGPNVMPVMPPMMQPMPGAILPALSASPQLFPR